MATNEDDTRPPSKRIADDLTLGVVSGAIAPGDRLPSTSELMAEYGVANQTVQNAIRILKDIGLAYSVKGQGSFVSNDIKPGDYADTISEVGSPLFRQILDRLDSIGGDIVEINRRLSALEGHSPESDSSESD